MNGKNTKTSIYTILYWKVQDKSIKESNFFVFLELFWPTFKKKNKFVFLQENYSEEEFCSLLSENGNLEYWINLLTVNDFFSDDEEGALQSTVLAKALVNLWKSKLKLEFPKLNFIVEYLEDQSTGDIGITFYQDEYERKNDLVKTSHSIRKPNKKK